MPSYSRLSAVLLVSSLAGSVCANHYMPPVKKGKRHGAAVVKRFGSDVVEKRDAPPTTVTFTAASVSESAIPTAAIDIDLLDASQSDEICTTDDAVSFTSVGVFFEVPAAGVAAANSACNLAYSATDYVLALPSKVWDDSEGVISPLCGLTASVTNQDNNVTVFAIVKEASGQADFTGVSESCYKALGANIDDGEFNAFVAVLANGTNSQGAIVTFAPTSSVPFAVASITSTLVTSSSSTSSVATTSSTEVKAADATTAPPPSSTHTTSSSKSTSYSSSASPVKAAVEAEPSSQSTTAAPASTTSKKSTTAAAPSSTSSSGGDGSLTTGGIATFYFQHNTAGACGNVNPDSAYIVALQTETYANGANCGKKILMKNLDNGKSTTAIVADECPTCDNAQSVDCSQGLFDYLSDNNEGEGTFNLGWELLD